MAMLVPYPDNFIFTSSTTPYSFNVEFSFFQLDPDFAFGLYELDYDIFGVHIAGAVNRIPCLEQVNETVWTKL
jgi:hypothetical protein